MPVPVSATDVFTRQEEPLFLPELGIQVYAGDTALHLAAAANDAARIQELLAAGADPQARNRRGCTPLHTAASAGSSQAITTLIAAGGADPNAQNMDGTTPLHRAVRCRRSEAVRTLLDHGADPTIRNKNGSTPGDLATRPTGRAGAGSTEAKAEQQKILALLANR